MSTTPTNLDALVARLEKVETQNRRLKRAGVAVLVLLGAFLVMGGKDQTKDQATHSSKFTLRDANGKDRAWLGMGKDGPTLRFLDENGAERAGLSMMKNGLALSWLDGRGKLMTGLSVQRSGVAVVSVDENGQLFVGANALKPDAGLFAPNVRK
jgi:hypothetical protein